MTDKQWLKENHNNPRALAEAAVECLDGYYLGFGSECIYRLESIITELRGRIESND